MKKTQNIDYLLSTFAIENLKPSKQAIELYKKMEIGEISLNEAIKIIEHIHKIKFNL